MLMEQDYISKIVNSEIYSDLNSNIKLSITSDFKTKLEFISQNFDVHDVL